MDTRELIAYSLIAIMVLMMGAWATYAYYNTRERKVARQRQRDRARRA